MLGALLPLLLGLACCGPRLFGLASCLPTVCPAALAGRRQEQGVPRSKANCVLIPHFVSWLLPLSPRAPPISFLGDDALTSKEKGF